MTGFSFKTVLFYAAYLCLAARAAPTVTTLSPTPAPTTSSGAAAELHAETTTDAGSAMLTTVAPDGPAVPPFQCSTLSTSDYQRSVSSLYTGFRLATTYIRNTVLTPGEFECSPTGARLSIFQRVNPEGTEPLTLELGFAIFQAYSKIAHFASESDTVSDAEQEKMQIVHEILNGLITNYYEVVSPDHCSCDSASSDSCVTIPSLDFLELESYPPTCSPAAYVATNVVNEFQDVLLKFLMSSQHRANYSEALTSCQQWKDDYLPSSSSMAASVLSC